MTASRVSAELVNPLWKLITFKSTMVLFVVASHLAAEIWYTLRQKYLEIPRVVWWFSAYVVNKPPCSFRLPLCVHSCLEFHLGQTPFNWEDLDDAHAGNLTHLYGGILMASRFWCSDTDGSGVSQSDPTIYTQATIYCCSQVQIWVSALEKQYQG